MTNNSEQYKFCPYKGKECAHYSSSMKATMGLVKVQLKSNEEEVPIRVYKCKCGSWHLTHLPLDIERECKKEERRNKNGKQK